jgi:hypothetical protein
MEELALIIAQELEGQRCLGEKPQHSPIAERGQRNPGQPAINLMYWAM